MRPAWEAELLARAKARLDRLQLYPRPVDASRVSIHVVPWLFRVPGFRRFRGYATFRRILLALVFLGIVGLTLELLLLEHWEPGWQLTPLVLLAIFAASALRSARAP